MAPGDAGVLGESGAQAGTEEDVVTEDEGDSVGADEPGTDDERLGEALGPLLRGIGQ